MALNETKQTQTVQPPINAVAKPAMKALSWMMVAAGAAALALAGVRTVRTGK
jgi:hypothetical protein